MSTILLLDVKNCQQAHSVWLSPFHGGLLHPGWGGFHIEESWRAGSVSSAELTESRAGPPTGYSTVDAGPPSRLEAQLWPEIMFVLWGKHFKKWFEAVGLVRSGHHVLQNDQPGRFCANHSTCHQLHRRWDPEIQKDFGELFRQFMLLDKSGCWSSAKFCGKSFKIFLPRWELANWVWLPLEGGISFTTPRLKMSPFNLIRFQGLLKDPLGFSQSLKVAVTTPIKFWIAQN